MALDRDNDYLGKNKKSTCEDRGQFHGLEELRIYYKDHRIQ